MNCGEELQIATSFLVPKSKEDIIKRGEAFYEWAKWSNGMFGRTPDYKNASITAFYGGAELLEVDLNGTSNALQ